MNGFAITREQLLEISALLTWVGSDTTCGFLTAEMVDRAMELSRQIEEFSNAKTFPF